MLRSPTDKPDIVIKNGKLDLVNAAKFLDISISTLIRITFRKSHPIPFIKKNNRLFYDLKDLKRINCSFKGRMPPWFQPEYYNIEGMLKDLENQFLTVKSSRLMHSEN